MKKTIFFIFIIGLTIICGTNYAQTNRLRYNIQLAVTNNTGMKGYFGVCDKPINSDQKALCNIPQEITKGETIIFIPYFEKTYPVFTTLDESAYTCGTKKTPKTQLPIAITSRYNNKLILNSFIKNKKGDLISILCSQ